MTAMNIAPLVAIATAVLLVPASLAQNLAGLCTASNMGLGLLYHPYPGTCEKYVQCDAGVQPRAMLCPFGLVWDDSSQSCVRVAGASCNPCSGITNTTDIAYSLLCNTYWTCSGGVATPNCCPQGQAFVAGSGCVPDVNCTVGCPNDTSTSNATGSCPLKASPQGSSFYQELVTGFGFVNRPCPVGTFFTNLTCGCHVLLHNETYTCKERLLLQFINGSFVDESKDEEYISVNNLQITAGKPYFTGNTRLYIPGFANIPFGPNLVLKVTFVPTGTASNQILLQNGLCSQGGPSLLILLNGNAASGYTVSFSIVVGSSTVRASVTANPAPPVMSANIEFPYASNSSLVYFEIENRGLGTTVASTTQAFSGSIPRVKAGLNLGKGECTSAGFSGFTGFLLETTVTTCNYGVS